MGPRMILSRILGLTSLCIVCIGSCVGCEIEVRGEDDQEGVYKVVPARMSLQDGVMLRQMRDNNLVHNKAG